MLSSVFSEYSWKKINCTLHGIEYKDIEVPSFWDDQSVSIVAGKFFRVVNGERENSIKQVITRIAETIGKWGKEQKYFSNNKEMTAFVQDLGRIMIEQRAAFNSPVFFNCGVVEEPQTSACFILGVEDTMESILDNIKLEGMIFKGGSGAGSNLSNLRSSYETLTGGGYSSGPVSFMDPLDASAGSIKSGGTTRRAACMRVLNIDHPDIIRQRNGMPGFIRCKAEEDKKCKFLIQHGFSSNLDTGVYSFAKYQNANNSVGVTDDFMKAWDSDQSWDTKTKKGETVHTYKAREIMDIICESAWECGDPGLQFADTMNLWNPIPDIKIESTNPCSEFVNIPFTSCNLASINLLSFLNPKTKEFDIAKYDHTITTIFTAQDILINKSSYPDPRFKANSVRYRPIGLGYCNLGALFVNLMHPYGNKESQNVTELLTAYLTLRAFEVSSTLALKLGGLEEAVNEKTKYIVNKHIGYANDFLSKGFTCNISNSSTIASNLSSIIERVRNLQIFRNCQTTLLAPTGTISFAMGAQTTGIEPFYRIVLWKELVGGGGLYMVAKSVENLLSSLGWKRNEKVSDLKDDLEGFVSLQNSEIQNIVKAAEGKYYLTWEDHMNVMVAAQKYLSGAISKTFNIPKSSTPKDIQDIYVSAWKNGLKAVSVYRNESKAVQILNDAESKIIIPKQERTLEIRGSQRKLPQTITTIRHGFKIGNHKGWIHLGFYPEKDGQSDIGEIWVRMDGFGDTINGLVDWACRSMSYALQYGAPIEKFIQSLWYMSFKPQGYTNDLIIKYAPSIPSYLVRKIANSIFSKKQLEEMGLVLPDNKPENQHKGKPSGDCCQTCGTEMLIIGRCRYCPTCRESTGGCE